MKPDRYYDEEYDDLYNQKGNDKDAVLHRFYLYDKKKETDYKLEPMLYAYTRDKEISDTFKLTRDPNMFIYKHSREPIEVIADIEHKHPGIRLRKTALRTRSKEDPTKLMDIPMVLTCEEELKVAASSDELYIILNVARCMENMSVLSTEANETLEKLEYFSIYRYLRSMQYLDEDPGYFYAGVGTGYGLESPMVMGILPDEFSLFMLMYGNTLRK